MVPSLPLLSCELSMSVKEIPDRKKNSDVTNALRQWNYVDELCRVMNRINKNLAKYFQFIISSKQLINPLPNLNNKKLLLRKKLNNRNNKRKLPTNCLSVFDHFVKLVLKGLKLTLDLVFEDKST